MNKITKRLLALALSVSMVISCWPVSLFTAQAEDGSSLSAEEIAALVNGDSLSLEDGDTDSTLVEVNDIDSTLVEVDNTLLEGDDIDTTTGSGETTICATCGNETCTCNSGEGEGEGDGSGDGTGETTTCATCGSTTCTCTCTEGECTCTAEDTTTQTGDTDAVTSGKAASTVDTDTATNGGIAVIEDEVITAGQTAADPIEETDNSQNFTVSIDEESGTCTIVSVASAGVDSDGKLIIPATFTDTSGVYTVVGIDSRAFYNMSNIVTVEIQTDSSYDHTSYVISSSAFYGCTGLTSITLPESLTYLDVSAFRGCTSLTSITLPASLTYLGTYAFYGCTALKSVTINASSLAINPYTFYQCTSLETVSAPADAITGIYNYAFAYCSALKTVDTLFGGNLTYLGDSAFCFCSSLETVDLSGVNAAFYFPESSGYQFYYCTSLKTVILPEDCENFTAFGINTFCECTSLETINLPDTLTSIGVQAFWCCSSLKNITWPTSGNLTTIGNSAFYYCISLETLSLPEGITTLGSNVFSYCRALSTVNLPESLIVTGESMFSECLNLVTVTGGENVTTVAASTFYLCKLLDDSMFASMTSIESIGTHAFYQCEAFETVTLTENICYIGDNAFLSCSSMTAIVIPEGKAELTIGVSAFGGCSSLTAIELPSNTVSVGMYAFVSTLNLTLIRINQNKGDLTGSPWGNACDPLVVWNSTIIEYATPATGETLYTLGENGEYAQYTGASTTTEVLYVSTDVSSYTLQTVEWLYDIIYKNDGTYALGDFSDSVDLLNEVAQSSLNTATMRQVYLSAYYGNEKETLTVPVTLTVTEDDNTYVYAVSTLAEYVFKGASFAAVDLPDTITTFGVGVFESCTSLLSIELPPAVTEIPDYLFSGCTKLASITASDNITISSVGQYAFYKCTALGADDISFINNSALTYIGDYAFYQCTSLTSLLLDKCTSLTQFGEDAFYGCTQLATVTVASTNNCFMYVGAYCFSACTALVDVSLPATSTSAVYIGMAAFYNCSQLTTITLPDGAGGTIQSRAFEDCSSLKSVGASTYTTIYSSAFNGCTSLESASFDAATSIGEKAFFECTSLKTVYFPSVTSIGWGAFYSDGLLSDLTISENITTIGEKAFMYCSALQTISFPYLTDLGFDAFYGCTSLDNIVIPSTVTALYAGTFQNCTSLSNITLAEGLQDIGTELLYIPEYVWISVNGQQVTITNEEGYDYAWCNEGSVFEGCTSLVSITLPSTVYSLGIDTFSGCTSLETVTFQNATTGEYSSTGCSIGANSFEDCTSLTTVYLPPALYDGSYPSGMFADCTNLENVYINDLNIAYIYTSNPWGSPTYTNIYYLLQDVLVQPTVIANADGTYTIYLSATYSGLINRIYWPSTTSTTATDGTTTFTYSATGSDYNYKLVGASACFSSYTVSENGAYTFAYTNDTQGTDYFTECTILITEIGTPTVTASSVAVQQVAATKITTEQELLDLVGAYAYLPIETRELTFDSIEISVAIDLQTETDSSSVATTAFTAGSLAGAAVDNVYLVTITTTPTTYPDKSASVTVEVTIIANTTAMIPFVDSVDIVDNEIPTASAYRGYITVVDSDTVTICYVWENSNTSETTDYSAATYLDSAYDYYDNDTASYISTDITVATTSEVATAEPSYFGLQQPQVANYVFSHWEITEDTSTSGTHTVTATAVMVSALDLTVPETGLQTDEALWFGITVVAGMLFILNNKKKRIKREET